MHSEPPDSDEIARAIVRVLSGDLLEREEIELRQWLDADPERRQLFAEMHAIWEEAGAGAPRWDTSSLARRIIAARKQASRRSPVQTRVRGVRLASVRQLAVAAALVAVVSTGLLYTSTRSPAQRAERAVALKEIVTKRGERASVQLPDGSRITVGPASTLRYPDRIEARAVREVYLAGDAYFEVIHDEARPFVVRTTHAVARDLGTAFLVRAHDDMPHVDVIVVEGLVSLAAPSGGGQDSLLLRPRDLGRVDSAGNLGVTRNVDLAPTLAWTRGQLVFRNAPVSEVAAEIARSYDVDVRIADPILRDLHFSGSFGPAPVADVISNFATSIGATAVQRSGGFVIVHGASR
jgi:transmembrane sensor